MYKVSIAEHSECLRMHCGSASYFYTKESKHYSNAKRVILRKDPNFISSLDFKNFFFTEDEFKELTSRNVPWVGVEEVDEKEISEEIKNQNKIELIEEENEDDDSQEIVEEDKENIPINGKTKDVNGKIMLQEMKAKEIISFVLDKTGEEINISLKNKQSIIKRARKILENCEVAVV